MESDRLAPSPILFEVTMPTHHPDTPHNGSGPEWNPRSVSVTITAQVIMFVVIATVNVLTLVVMAMTRKLRTIPNTYIASLAVSDLVVSVNQLIAIPWTHPATHVYFETYSSLCLFFKCLLHANEMISLLTIVLIGMDRFFYIRRPFWYLRVVTRRKVTAVIILVWLVCLAAIPIRLAPSSSRYPGCDAYALLYDSETVAFLNGVFFFLVCSVLFVAYGVVIRTAIKQARAISVSQRRFFVDKPSSANVSSTFSTISPSSIITPETTVVDSLGSMQQNNELSTTTTTTSMPEMTIVGSRGSKQRTSHDTSPTATTPITATARPQQQHQLFSSSPSSVTSSTFTATATTTTKASAKQLSSSSPPAHPSPSWPPQEQQRNNHQRGSEDSNRPTKRRKNSEDRTLKAKLSLRIVQKMAGVFLVLFVCWTPYVVVGLLGPMSVSPTLVMMTGFLAAFNSAANFGVYALADREFRAATWAVLLRCCGHCGGRCGVAVRGVTSSGGDVTMSGSGAGGRKRYGTETTCA